MDNFETLGGDFHKKTTLGEGGHIKNLNIKHNNYQKMGKCRLERQ